MLRQYSWPGNVRELRNFIESMVIFHDGELIEATDLPRELRHGRQSGEAAPVQIMSGETRNMAEIERRAILETLVLTGGKRAEAAKILGIGLRTLQRKVKEYREAGYLEE